MNNADMFVFVANDAEETAETAGSNALITEIPPQDRISEIARHADAQTDLGKVDFDNGVYFVIPLRLDRGI